MAGVFAAAACRAGRIAIGKNGSGQRGTGELFQGNQRIEPKTAESHVCLLTKRGVEEGGYQFFPEGYPTS